MINYCECFQFYRRLLHAYKGIYTEGIINWYQENCRIYLDEVNK